MILTTTRLLWDQPTTCIHRLPTCPPACLSPHNAPAVTGNQPRAYTACLTARLPACPARRQLVHGGANQGGLLADLWILNTDQRVWTRPDIVGPNLPGE